MESSSPASCSKQINTEFRPICIVRIDLENLCAHWFCSLSGQPLSVLDYTYTDIFLNVFFLHCVSNQNLPFLRVWLLSLISLLWTSVRSLAQSSLYLPLYAERLFYPQPVSPQPAVFSQSQVKNFCCLCISWISSPPIPPICLDPSECHPCPWIVLTALYFSVVCKIGAFYLFQVTVEKTNKPPTR